MLAAIPYLKAPVRAKWLIARWKNGEVSASMRAAFEKLSFRELHHTAGLRRCHSVACS